MKYHPIATTNYHIRRQIRESGESSRVLAKRFCVNPKTILKWRQRQQVTDNPRGTQARRYRLSLWEQKIIVKARKHLKVPLDDLLIIIKKHIPHANRDNLYRVLKRHGLNRLPNAFKDRKVGKFGKYLPGFVHLDLAYLPILAGSHQRRYILVAIDRVTKMVFIQMVTGKTQTNAIAFLKSLNAWLPYRIHRILTDNGREFGKGFTAACKQLGIKHKRTKVKHPWTNGQVERINGIIKQQTVKQKFYPDYQELWKDLIAWQNDYNFHRGLKSLDGLTPFEKVVEYYQSLDDLQKRQRFYKPPSRVLLQVYPPYTAPMN